MFGNRKIEHESPRNYISLERERSTDPWACTMSIIFSTSPCDLFHWLTAIARKPFSRVERRNERAEQKRERPRVGNRGAGRRVRSRYTPQRCLVCQWLTKCTIYPHMHARERCLRACRTIPIYKVDREIQSGKVILAWTDSIHRGGDSSSLLLFSFFFLSIIIFTSRLFIHSFDDDDFSRRVLPFLGNFSGCNAGFFGLSNKRGYFLFLFKFGRNFTKSMYYCNIFKIWDIYIWMIDVDFKQEKI